MIGNCSLKFFSKDMFMYTPRLVYLVLSACNILEIEEGAFGNLKYLEHLDVSFNQHLGFWSLPNITRDLNKTSIKTFRFKGINCLAGMSGNILKRSLQYLQNTQSSEINFEKNKLDHFELGLLRLLPDTLTTILWEKWNLRRECLLLIISCSKIDNSIISAYKCAHFLIRHQNLIAVMIDMIIVCLITSIG